MHASHTSRAGATTGSASTATGTRTGVPESLVEITKASAHTAAPDDVLAAPGLARAARSWKRDNGFRGRQLPGGHIATVVGAPCAAPLRSALQD